MIGNFLNLQFLHAFGRHTCNSVLECSYSAFHVLRICLHVGLANVKLSLDLNPGDEKSSVFVRAGAVAVKIVVGTAGTELFES